MNTIQTLVENPRVGNNMARENWHHQHQKSSKKYLHHTVENYHFYCLVFEPEEFQLQASGVLYGRDVCAPGRREFAADRNSRLGSQAAR